MCVNDILCRGARPIFFLDYIACGKNVPERIADIVAGVAEGCVQAGAALIGGETAEMPGFYPEDEYDLAGFAVGIVDKDRMTDRRKVKPGDVLVAIPSSGVHSNGFSLVRKILADSNADLNSYVPEFGATLGKTSLTPTRIYAKQVNALMEKVEIKSMAHITKNCPEVWQTVSALELRKQRLRRFPFLIGWRRQATLPRERCSMSLIWVSA